MRASRSAILTYLLGVDSDLCDNVFCLAWNITYMLFQQNSNICCAICIYCVCGDKSDNVPLTYLIRYVKIRTYLSTNKIRTI